MTQKTDFPVATAADAAASGTSLNPSADNTPIAADAAPASGAAPAAGLEMPEVNVPDALPDDGSCDKALDMLGDVELDVKVELGRCQMLVGDVLRLTEGDVVELDKLAGDPVDVYVNDRLVARGEVLVVNENFCVRVNQIVAKED
jgi:flagellar motor switch protein FliN